MFAQVKDVIESALNSKGGVALLVPHVDYHFINYLGRTLLKSLTELNYFFIEAPHSILSKNIANLDKVFAKIPTLVESEKIEVCAKTVKFGHSFSREEDNNSVLFAALCAHIHGIKVVGIDKEEVDVDSILALPSHQFAEHRIGSNEVMFQNVQKVIQQRGKYIVLIGPMHYGVAQKLGIETIAVIDNSYYERFCEIAPSSGMDFSGAIMDYKFTYSIDINVNLSTKDKLLPIRQDAHTNSKAIKQILSSYIAYEGKQKTRGKPISENFNLTINGVSKEDPLLKELDPEEVNQGEINITVTKQFIQNLKKLL